MENEIDGKEFIKARRAELENLTKKISPTKKKKMLFQRLPYYKRRRLKSYKNTRRRGKCSSEIFFAKRFSMIELNNRKIAYKRLLKGEKFIYKSLKEQKRGYFMDMSFRRLFLNKGCCFFENGVFGIGFECGHFSGDEVCLDGYDLIYVINCDYRPGFYDIESQKLVYNGDFFGRDGYNSVCLKSENENSPEFQKRCLTNENGFTKAYDFKEEYHSLQADRLNSLKNNFQKNYINKDNNRYDLNEDNAINDLNRINKKYDLNKDNNTYDLKNYISDAYVELCGTKEADIPKTNNSSIELLLSKDPHNTNKQQPTKSIKKLFQNKILIFSINERESMILSPKNTTMALYQNLISAGCIPIGIYDYLRIALELRKITIFDKFDSLYRKVEKEITLPAIEKYKRTPKGKKINYQKLKIMDPFVIPEIKGKVYYFESDQVFDRCAVIYGIKHDEYKNICDKFRRITLEQIKDQFSNIIPEETYTNESKKRDSISEQHLISLKYSKKEYEVKLEEHISGYLFEINNIIGYVIRGSFCFSIGKGRGVCILDYDEMRYYFARNINSKKSSHIDIINEGVSFL